MTALMLQTMTSTDPEVQPAIEQMERNNREMFDRILNGVAPENFANVSFGLNAALSAALTGLLTGRLTRRIAGPRRVGHSGARRGPRPPGIDALAESGPTLVPRAYGGYIAMRVTSPRDRMVAPAALLIRERGAPPHRDRRRAGAQRRAARLGLPLLSRRP